MPNVYRAPIDPGYGSAALLIANGVRDALANVQAGRDRRFALAEHERALAQQAEDRARAERDRTVTRRMAGVYPATRAPSTPFAASVALRGNPAAGAAQGIADAIARTMPATRAVADDPVLRSMATYDLGENEVYVPEASADMIEARERTRAALAAGQEAETQEQERKLEEARAAARGAGVPEAEVEGFARQLLLRPGLLSERMKANRPKPARSTSGGRSGGGGSRGGRAPSASTSRADRSETRRVGLETAERLFREGKSEQEVRNYLYRTDQPTRALGPGELRNLASQAQTNVQRERRGAASGGAARPSGNRPPAPGGARAAQGGGAKPSISRGEYDALRGRNWTDAQIREKFTVRN